MKDFIYESLLKNQTLRIDDILEKISKQRFANKNDYQSITEEDIKNYDIVSIHKNYDIWVSFILMGHFFGKNYKIDLEIFEQTKNYEIQSNLSCHAHFNIGYICSTKIGNFQNNYSDRQAFTWYKRAARQNHVFAQYFLSLMLIKGQEINFNYIEAFEWCDKAANQGFELAQYKLGCLYDEGQGVVKDKIEALKWYRKSANQNNILSQHRLGVIYEEGKEITRNYRAAIEWYTRAAIQGCALSQLSLGILYGYGRGVEKDDNQALIWYTKAANQGNELAQLNLGVMYDQGSGIDKNYIEAIKWYNKAADQKNRLAQFCLGAIYEQGHGVAKDFAYALEWYRKSSINNDNVVEKKFNIARYNFKNAFNIQLTINDIINDTHLKNQMNILRCNIEKIIGLHEQEKGINNPNSYFKERSISIPFLFEVYQEVVDFEQKCLEALIALDKNGFMVTCLQPKNKSLIEQLDTRNSQHMSSYLDVNNNFRYISFGQKNVVMANKFLTLINDRNSKGLKYVNLLIKINNDLHLKYVKKSIQNQKLIRLNDNTIDLKEKLVFERKIHKYNKLSKSVFDHLEELTQVIQFPDQIKKLFIETVNYRNRIFLAKHSFLKTAN